MRKFRASTESFLDLKISKNLSYACIQQISYKLHVTLTSTAGQILCYRVAARSQNCGEKFVICCQSEKIITIDAAIEAFMPITIERASFSTCTGLFPWRQGVRRKGDWMICSVWHDVGGYSSNTVC